MIARALRAFAILIAVAAVVDPAVTITRRDKPVVAVVAAGAADSALASRVVRELDRDFTVIRAPLPGAAATVVAGTQLPRDVGDVRARAFAVIAESDGPAVSIEVAHAPGRASLDARVPVDVSARVQSARGKSVVYALRAGDVIVDRAERRVTSDDEMQRVTLEFVAAEAGSAALRVTASLSGEAPAAADLAVDVRDERRAVLVFDPRPSWMSTFVRRAIKNDPRLAVTSRVITSRNISTDAGRPPANLDDLAALSLFDAVVVGAPELLTERDVSALDAFMRRRGGAVVLVLDQRVPGPYERLMHATSWGEASGGPAVAITDAGGGALHASEFAWPADLPGGADAVARSAATPLTIAHPVVWRTPAGAGRLIVSGALDAWQFRDGPASPFAAFWRSVIAGAASDAANALDVSVERTMLAPGEASELTVVVRDAALGPLTTSRAVHAEASASIETAAGAVNVRLWPSGRPGEFRGTLRAPVAPGSYRISVSGNGARTAIPIIVAPGASHPSPDERDLMRAWAASRGGSSVSPSQLGELHATLFREAYGASRRVPVHPMRSPWWILPFALSLGAEWFARRRRGLV